MRQRRVMDLREGHVSIEGLAGLDAAAQEVDRPARDLRVDEPAGFQIVDFAVPGLVALAALQDVRRRRDVWVEADGGSPGAYRGRVRNAVPFVEALIGGI